MCLSLTFPTCCDRRYFLLFCTREFGGRDALKRIVDSIKDALQCIVLSAGRVIKQPVVGMTRGDQIFAPCAPNHLVVDLGHLSAPSSRQTDPVGFREAVAGWGVVIGVGGEWRGCGGTVGRKRWPSEIRVETEFIRVRIRVQFRKLLRKFPAQISLSKVDI
jgi:hypothetical protein